VSRTRAFTLIELLVVVAIIAILAAIAIPNMLEAQTRSKVSRTSADLRTVGVALESYRVDSNNYPAENYQSPLLVSAWGSQFLPNAVRLQPLTTPIAYIASLPVDVFDPGNDPLNQVRPPTFHYVSVNDPMDPGSPPFFYGQNEEHLNFQWMVQSYGPDRGSDGGESHTYWQFPRYDPTNGTVSIGNILRSGP
jgi:type II secretion system protein G